MAKPDKHATKQLTSDGAKAERLGAASGWSSVQTVLDRAAILLAFEQALVSADDLSRVKMAFDLNGYVGILYFLMTVAAMYVH